MEEYEVKCLPSLLPPLNAVNMHTPAAQMLILQQSVAQDVTHNGSIFLIKPMTLLTTLKIDIVSVDNRN